MYIHNEYYLAMRKKKMPFAATWINLKDIMVKWSKLDREKQILYDLTYFGGILKKKKSLIHRKK